MGTLREQLIRLAFEKKALRPHILPLVREASRAGDAFKLLLLNSGIPERDLIEKNPSKILREAADYISVEGLFESFDSGPVKYRDLKVTGFHEDIDDDVINWEIKLLLPWPAATRLVLYTVADDRHVGLAPQFAKSREFQQLVSKGMPIKAKSPLVYDELYDYVSEHVDFRIEHEMGYENYRELKHESEELVGKWTSSGLEITLIGQSWG